MSGWLHFYQNSRLTAGFVVRNGMNMKEIMTRIEMVAENQEKLIADTRSDLRGISSDMQSMERRIVDKMDKNQKQLVCLLVLVILMPIFIALVAK